MAEIYYEPTSCTCRGTSYTEEQINAAAQRALELTSQGRTLGEDNYPHAYNDYEHFSFAHARAPYIEFPILTSGVYDGGSPGADRVVLGSIADDYSSAVYAATITHHGASGNDFRECVDDEGGRTRRPAPEDTRNDLLNGVCKPITVIFARGTFELGNVGLLAGPPFFNALESLIGAENLAVQGVEYPANVEGYLKGGDTKGANTTAHLANLAATQCPDTQIVMSGYSQGAQLIHLSLQNPSSTPATTISHIAAIVLFGDPDDNQPIADIPNEGPSKVDTFCAAKDLICDGLPLPLVAHLGYAEDAGKAAAFVAGRVVV